MYRARVSINFKVDSQLNELTPTTLLVLLKTVENVFKQNTRDEIFVKHFAFLFL